MLGRREKAGEEQVKVASLASTRGVNEDARGRPGRRYAELATRCPTCTVMTAPSSAGAGEGLSTSRLHLALWMSASPPADSTWLCG